VCGWGHGSRGRVFTQCALGPGFNPQYLKKNMHCELGKIIITVLQFPNVKMEMAIVTSS
jgi:hypothetical protein